MMKERSGFTNVGFSRNFGCCSHWQYCNMGKESCFYEKIDPDTMKACSAWNRQHVAPNTIRELSIEDIESKTNLNEEFEQLTLFD